MHMYNVIGYNCVIPDYMHVATLQLAVSVPKANILLAIDRDHWELVSCASCSDACHIACVNLDVQPGQIESSNCNPVKTSKKIKACNH